MGQRSGAKGQTLAEVANVGEQGGLDQRGRNIHYCKVRNGQSKRNRKLAADIFCEQAASARTMAFHEIDLLVFATTDKRKRDSLI